MITRVIYWTLTLSTAVALSGCETMKDLFG